MKDVRRCDGRTLEKYANVPLAFFLHLSIQLINRPHQELTFGTKCTTINQYQIAPLGANDSLFFSLLPHVVKSDDRWCEACKKCSASKMPSFLHGGLLHNQFIRSIVGLIHFLSTSFSKHPILFNRWVSSVLCDTNVGRLVVAFSAAGPIHLAFCFGRCDVRSVVRPVQFLTRSLPN